jgi:heme/copper-type cytochrome/quinol oxidase subunit 4
MKLYLTVFASLLLIVAIEVVLTYLRLPTETLLFALLALALVEAGLGLLYFMHLKYERRLFWSLIPALIFVFIMMNQFWADAHRLRTLHQVTTPAPAADQGHS